MWEKGKMRMTQYGNDGTDLASGRKILERDDAPKNFGSGYGKAATVF